MTARPVRLLLAALIFPLLMRAQTPAPSLAPRLSMLAAEPDWSALDRFQSTITRGEFTRLLDTIYAPGGAWHAAIQVNDGSAGILASGTARFVLHFAGSGEAKPPPRYWHPLESIPRGALPLSGLKIALDPGHLGGDWARMEERWFQIGPDTKPVAEGDMTLLTAHILAKELKAQGAQVLFVHGKPGPLTTLRPADLRDAAREDLRRQGLRFIRDGYGGPADELRMNSIQWTSELLFYRTAEIQARARLVNDVLKPGLVLCMHYNAEPWGDPAKPQLVEKDHMHVIVNGCYNAAELALDDVRYSMLVKLLTRTAPEELALSAQIADSLSAANGLPPYQYITPNAIRVGPNPCVWARDLLANRLYECPVIYIEPYVMNSPEVWDRVQAGDYDGQKLIHGKMRKSIYREYADAVAAALVTAAANRPPR